MDDLLRGFEDVDRSADRQSFFEFLDLAARLPSIYRERMLELCPTGHGSTVLDIGCGLGGETTRIARQVGKTGMVYGVDTSEEMITEARRRTRELDVSPQFQVCDAHSLTFKDASFDVCRAERVFLYLENPATAIVDHANSPPRSPTHRPILILEKIECGTTAGFQNFSEQKSASLWACPQKQISNRFYQRHG